MAYVAAGLVVGVMVVRRRSPPAFAALAAVTALQGLGSWLYHGDNGDLARFLHDVSLIGVLSFLAGWHVGRLGDRSDRGALIGLSAGLAAGTVTNLAAPGATNLVVGALVTAVVVAEIAARHRGEPAVWTAPLIGIGAVALALWFAGTSGSPLCAEQSWLQPHGGWHVLTALLVVAWADRAGRVPAP